MNITELLLNAGMTLSNETAETRDPMDYSVSDMFYEENNDILAEDFGDPWPCASVPTGIAANNTPVGVQVVASRFREDLCLAAAEIIEAHAPKLTPIDPR